MKEDRGFKTIERLILLSALLIVVLFWIFGKSDKVPGAIAGGLIAYLNFVFIKVIILRALGRKGKIRFAIAVMYGVKFLAVALAVYFIVSSGRFDMVGFLVGFSSLLVGIMLEGVRRAIWEDKEKEEEG